MKHRWPIIILLLTACGDGKEAIVEHALQLGNAQYDAARFLEAVTTYGSAPGDHRTVYNKGVAYYRTGLLPEAITELGTAATLTNDPRQASRAFYSLATARAHEAFWADSVQERAGELLDGIRIEGDDIAQQVRMVVLRDSLQREQHRLRMLTDSSLAGASSAYKEALRRAPKDEEARYGLMRVLSTIEARRKAKADREMGSNENEDQRKELSARAQLLVQRADSLVEAYRFKEALTVLEQGLKQEPTLKDKEQYMQKLEVVTKAANAE
ncbi:MAG: tetratricopeptide repeat protein [Flavobacteriales bacterium]